MIEVYFTHGTRVAATSFEAMIAKLRFRKDIPDVERVVYKYQVPYSFIHETRTMHVRVRHLEDLERAIYGLRQIEFL
jgi:hypothetical protein